VRKCLQERKNEKEGWIKREILREDVKRYPFSSFFFIEKKKKGSYFSVLSFHFLCCMLASCEEGRQNKVK